MSGSFDPSLTQKVKVEIARGGGDTDRGRVLDLHMYLIQNLDQGVKDTAHRLEALAERTLEELQVKNWILGALTADAQRHKDAIKNYYKRVFWRVVMPLATAAGTALSALLHQILTSHWAAAVPK